MKASTLLLVITLVAIANANMGFLSENQIDLRNLAQNSIDCAVALGQVRELTRITVARMSNAAGDGTETNIIAYLGTDLADCASNWDHELFFLDYDPATIPVGDIDETDMSGKLYWDPTLNLGNTDSDLFSSSATNFRSLAFNGGSRNPPEFHKFEYTVSTNYINWLTNPSTGLGAFWVEEMMNGNN